MKSYNYTGYLISVHTIYRTIIICLILTNCLTFYQLANQNEDVIESYTAKTYGSEQFVELVSVHDGDTFTVNITSFPDIIGKAISVRINGIDAPELNDKAMSNAAKKSREKLKGLLEHSKYIKLSEMTRDKYFRICAKVQIDSGDVAMMMIDSKMAKPYDGGKKPLWTYKDF